MYLFFYFFIHLFISLFIYLTNEHKLNIRVKECFCHDVLFNSFSQQLPKEYERPPPYSYAQTDNAPPSAASRGTPSVDV